MHTFEYDKSKSNLNETKHGISFEEAKKLWNDPAALAAETTNKGEMRYLLIAKLDDKYWSTIYTYRKSNIRLISVRRSRKNEVLAYESQRVR